MRAAQYNKTFHRFSASLRQRISGGTVGARDGIRTHDPNLTKIVRYLCATRAYRCVVAPY